MPRAATGTDLKLDNAQLDHLLQGKFHHHAVGWPTQDGTELRDLAINAQRISLSASGSANSANLDLTADFKVPTLADIDPNFAGTLNANARLVGGPGARQLTVTGAASTCRPALPPSTALSPVRPSLMPSCRKARTGSA